MLSYLGAEGIPSSEYPKVRLIEEGLTTYCSRTKSITLTPEFKSDGFTLGEEITHWLHQRRLEARGESLEFDPKLGQVAVFNTREFVGFIGREVAYQACRGTELEALFDPRHMPATSVDPDELLSLFMKCQLLAPYIDQDPLTALSTKITEFGQVVARAERLWNEVKPQASKVEPEKLLSVVNENHQKLLGAIEHLQGSSDEISRSLSAKLEGLPFAQGVSLLMATTLSRSLSECKKSIGRVHLTATYVLSEGQPGEQASSAQMPSPITFLDPMYTQLHRGLMQTAAALPASVEQISSFLHNGFLNVLGHYQGYGVAAEYLRREVDVRELMTTALSSSLSSVFQSTILPTVRSVSMGVLLKAIGSARHEPADADDRNSAR
jgi:hypothetical protein